MAGLTQIKIPVKASERTIEKIVPYLPTIFSTFEKNSKQIRADYDLYCLEHEINSKTRPHDDEINNIVVSPHIRSMVQWKTGYILGNPIKYAQSKSTQTDDITTLNTYIRHSNKGSVDKQVAEWAYACGVGYYFIQPKSVAVNVSHEAPFDIYCIDADTCGKVYSSYLGNEALCDFLYSENVTIDEDGKKETIRLISIYMPEALYVYQKKGSRQFELVEEQERGLYTKLPLVEMTYHNRIGISAVARSLQYAVDRIASDGVDNIQDVVNEIWVFLNTSLGKTNDEKATNLLAMKKNGAIELTSANPDLPADVKTIMTKLNLTEVMDTRAVLLKEMYDTNGVPISSSAISSGNVTKGGGEVANGYENAYNRALDDKNSFMPAQRKVLDRIIGICHKTPDCRIDELQASEIEIKYCFNMSDNMLTKTQSYVNLVEACVPPAMALEKVKLSNDSEAEGQMVEQYIEKLEKRKLEAEKVLATNKSAREGTQNNSQG